MSRTTTEPSIRILPLLGAASLLLVGACGGSATPTPEVPPLEDDRETAIERESPPPSGPARDVTFPEIHRETLDNGLSLDVVPAGRLPVVYLRLVIQSGGETDPENLPGLSSLVADMLKEGTRGKSSAELAEAIEFLGADLWTYSDEENVYVVARTLKEHLGPTMELLAEVATQPAFDRSELEKLVRRERDRLAMSLREPTYLARRAFYERLYGEHPYGTIDTTTEALERLRRAHLRRWHRRHFVPSNAVLVASGDIQPGELRVAAEEALGEWRGPAVSRAELPEPPSRESRQIVVVDRPGSVQSVILAGNLAVPRKSERWVPLMVANQVLGGSASSRLFMDLREQRSLTYGAYSSVGERVDVGPFVASTSVRTEVTEEALGALFEHLDRIVGEAPPDEEIENARNLLSDSFPLKIDTPGKIAQLVADLRTFGLPDDYWDGFRSRIREVTPEDALQAAQATIQPEAALVVVVGEAEAFAESLRSFGPVTVVSVDGEVLGNYESGLSETEPAEGAPSAGDSTEAESPGRGEESAEGE